MKMDFFGLRDKMQPEKENKGRKRKTRKRKTRSTQIMYTFFKQCKQMRIPLNKQIFFLKILNKINFNISVFKKN